MLVRTQQHSDRAETKLCELIDEGYRAMQERKVSTIEEVRAELERQRERRD